MKTKYIFFFSLFFLFPFFSHASVIYDNSVCGLEADYTLWDERPRSIYWKATDSFILEDFSLYLHMAGTAPVQDFYYITIKIYRGSTTTDPVTDGLLVGETAMYVDIPAEEANRALVTFSNFTEGTYIYEGAEYLFVIETGAPYTAENYIVMNGDSLGCSYSSEYEDTKITTLYINNYPPFEDYSIVGTYSDYDEWRIAMVLEGAYTGDTEFEQFTTIWGADSSNNIYTLDCYATDEYEPIACASEVLLNTLFVFSTSTALLLDENYTNVRLGKTNGDALEPSAYYDVFDFRSETGIFYKTYTFTGIDDTASSTIVIDVCTGNTDNEVTSDTACTKMYFGNGYATTTYEQLLYTSGILNTDDSVTLWEENGCDDIGITDVKKGVQCALIWAFAPPQSSIQRFNTLKDNILSLYPIGYATLAIGDFTEAIGTTTTDYFDREIPIGELFGQEGGTTTIEFDSLLEYKEIGRPIFDWVEFIMWFGFIIWLIMWGTTRTL
jgi:hypothetical protein